MKSNKDVSMSVKRKQKLGLKYEAETDVLTSGVVVSE